MGLQGPDFSDSRDSMIIFSDSRDPNRVPKTPKNLLYMQILILNLQSTYHKIENLQLILNMKHAGPYFHLGALSSFKMEARSERFAINVIQISTTRSRYVHWTSCSNS